MASPVFDSNAWYSIQNFGNDYYIGCSNIGSCGINTTGLNSSELFQINTVNGNSPFYIRPKSINTDSSGQQYCVNINSGAPAIAVCSNSSAIWGTGYWSGDDAGEGLFFFSTQQGDSDRLYLSDENAFSLLDYTSASQSEVDLMRWGVSSRSAINDESYSTVPAAIASATTSLPTTTTSTTSTSTSASTTSDSTSSTTTESTASESTSESSSVAPITPSTSTQFITTMPTSSTELPSTMTVVVTPTPTADTSTSSGGSRTSSSTTPTLVNSGRKVASSSMAAIAVMFVVPAIVSWLV